jgi:hypothetical protein
MNPPLIVVGFLPEAFKRLVDLQRAIHAKERAMTFDEQRDFAERLRLALENNQPVVVHS